MRFGPDSPFFRHMEQRSVYLFIIAVLVLTAGYLGYRVAQQGDMIEVQSGQIVEGNLEREALELDLQKLRFSYDPADGEQLDDGGNVRTAQRD